MTHRLSVLSASLAVCRLGPDEALPDWLPWRSGFVSVSRTAEELSVVCPAEVVPGGVMAVRDWRAIKVEGPLDFAKTGVLAGLAVPLAEAGISIFAVSTYDTDYLLVREGDLAAAVAVLGRTSQVTAR